MSEFGMGGLPARVVQRDTVPAARHGVLDDQVQPLHPVLMFDRRPEHSGEVDDVVTGRPDLPFESVVGEGRHDIAHVGLARLPGDAARGGDRVLATDDNIGEIEGDIDRVRSDGLDQGDDMAGLI